MLILVIIDAFSGSEGFKIGDFFGQVFCTGDYVNMVLHDDIGIQNNSLFGDQEAERIEKYCSNLLVAKKGQPVDGGGGEEVGGGITWKELVSGTGHRFKGRGASGWEVPTRSMGTRKNPLSAIRCQPSLPGTAALRPGEWAGMFGLPARSAMVRDSLRMRW